MCGGASVGTLGFGGKDTFKKQARDLASGINLPNKDIVQFILQKIIKDERPILENYLQNMLLTFVWNNNNESIYIGGGGRYDDLIKLLGSENRIPAVGAALNLKKVERISQIESL